MEKKKRFGRKVLCLSLLAVLTACSENEVSIAGEWTEPAPGMAGMRQGFRLEEGGVASSVNMSTLRYESWERQGDRLILSGSSIGNRQTIRFSDTLTIKALSADTLTVEKGSLTLTYTRTGQETNK